MQRICARNDMKYLVMKKGAYTEFVDISPEVSLRDNPVFSNRCCKSYNYPFITSYIPARAATSSADKARL
jgi:hypothetical protein